LIDRLRARSGFRPRCRESGAEVTGPACVRATRRNALQGADSAATLVRQRRVDGIADGFGGTPPNESDS
jgi:hypothetical protein